MEHEGHGAMRKENVSYIWEGRVRQGVESEDNKFKLNAEEKEETVQGIKDGAMLSAR